MTKLENDQNWKWPKLKMKKFKSGKNEKWQNLKMTKSKNLPDASELVALWVELNYCSGWYRSNRFGCLANWTYHAHFAGVFEGESKFEISCHTRPHGKWIVFEWTKVFDCKFFQNFLNFFSWLSSLNSLMFTTRLIKLSNFGTSSPKLGPPITGNFANVI